MPSDDSLTRSGPSDESRVPPGTVIAAGILFFAAMLLGATLYALGQSVERFRWDTLRNGGLLFLVIVSGLTAAALILAASIKVASVLTPAVFRGHRGRRRLQQAKRKVRQTIGRRHELQEEQARLTAMMQASFLYERESARIANSQAVREFQKALQSGVVRSCEVVFQHLNRTVDQYEQVVFEVESSSLTADEKAELLESLTRQLNISGLNERHQRTQKLMEDAIWRVRFRKARILARRNPDSARRYLQSLRESDTSHRILIQLESLLKELQDAAPISTSPGNS